MADLIQRQGGFFGELFVSLKIESFGPRLAGTNVIQIGPRLVQFIALNIRVIDDSEEKRLGFLQIPPSQQLQSLSERIKYKHVSV